MMSNDADINDNVRSQKEHLLPIPPSLPALSEKCRRSKSRFAVESCQPQCDTSASCLNLESAINERHHEYDTTDTAINVIKTKFLRSCNDVISEISAASNNASDNPVPKTASKSFLYSSPKRRALEEYPPLFFTLRDFEDVMFSTRNDDSFANVPSTNLDSQDSREKESSIARIPDDVCFRVTTTNLPFEKCLDRWREDPFDNDKFGQEFDNYRFEDSESDRMNVRKMSDYISDYNDYSECRAVTKVQFIIKSPSTTLKHDSDRKNDMSCENLQNCEFLLANDDHANIQNVVSSVKLIGNQDECTNVKNGNNSRDKSSNTCEKEKFTTIEDDAFISSSVNKIETISKTVPQVRYDDKSKGVNYEAISKEDDFLNRTLQNELVSDEILIRGKENKHMLVMEETISGKHTVKQTNQSERLDVTLNIIENVCPFSNKSLKITCRNEQVNTTEIIQKRGRQEGEIFVKTAAVDIKEKYAIKNETSFINESFQNSLNDHANDNVNQNTFYDSLRERTFSDDLANKSAENEESRRLSTEETKKTNDPVNSENDREKVLEEIFAKSVPVKVRRNSFLETMLSDTEDTPLNFQVISTQSIVSSPSINKETLNTKKKTSDKIELNTDIISRESEFGSNEATKIDTKDQKVLKDLKKIKKVIKVPSTNVKIVQSENKSAGDIKNDVLNELLCNFSNIKLKIVSPENKQSTIRIGDDENIACPVMIDNRICKEKESASSDSLTFEGSQNEVRCESIDVNTDIVERLVKKEEYTKIKIEERSQDGKNDTHDPEIDRKTTKNKNIHMTTFDKSSCNIKTEKHSSSKIEKKFSDIALKETCVKTEKTTSKNAEITSESNKSRDIRSSKLILKKTKAEYERQQTNEFQKKILIGVPATMNKIFDSRDLETNTSRKISLEDEKKNNVTSKKTHYSIEKTDRVNADECAVDQKRIAIQSVLEITTNSGDKCAIVKKTTSAPCNNNDNNRAVTPVASISNDQSFYDVVTITPGKVRSFIKYYEIRSDATTNVGSYSKINDREKVASKSSKSHTASITARNSQRSEAIITDSHGLRGWVGSATSNDAPQMSSNKPQLSSTLRHSEDSPNNSVFKTLEEKSMATKEYKKNMLDEETRALPSKAGVKKSVQFRSGFTVIHSETYDRDESSWIVANTSKKKRAPPSLQDYQEFVREIKSEKLLNAKKSFSQRRWETVTQIHAVASHEENPGINSFVPKPEIPQLVFYCTI